MATRTLELTDEDIQDLKLACLGRITVIKDLVMATRDPEARAQLESRQERLRVLVHRLAATPTAGPMPSDLPVFLADDQADAIKAALRAHLPELKENWAFQGTRGATHALHVAQCALAKVTEVFP